MEWLSIFRSTFYYLLFPLTALGKLLLVVLAPLIHLGNYTIHTLIAPLMLLGKLQTLYIYFGVAAIIGLLTGSILHFSSRILASILDIGSLSEETGRTAASVRELKEQKKLEGAWEFSTPVKRNEGRVLVDDVLKREYTDLGKGLGKRNKGLLSQTILEEDGSEDDI